MPIDWTAAPAEEPELVIPTLDTHRSVRDLSLQVGTYGAAAALAMLTHPGAVELTRDEALALLAMGIHADLALRSGDGYRGTAAEDLARLVPDLTTPHARVLQSRLTNHGMVELSPARGFPYYRLAPSITDPFDVAAPRPSS